MGVRPIVWIIWVALATILAILLIYRGTLLENEDDQIFLDANAVNQEHEQEVILKRAQKLTPYVYTATAVTCLMGLGILAYIVMEGLRNL